ncbi:hypothetical protein PG994_003254 [Apiospora phragmitis]|uniref:Uncharacterized protein n=1 Tax=Apiospora phragmitis TaxID=2905665 RepID=A0ABR1VYS2_9PEZI
MSKSSTGRRCRDDAGFITLCLLALFTVAVMIAIPVISKIKHGHDRPGAHSVTVAAAAAVAKCSPPKNDTRVVGSRAVTGCGDAHRPYYKNGTSVHNNETSISVKKTPSPRL